MMAASSVREHKWHIKHVGDLIVTITPCGPGWAATVFRGGIRIGRLAAAGEDLARAAAERLVAELLEEGGVPCSTR